MKGKVKRSLFLALLSALIALTGCAYSRALGGDGWITGRLDPAQDPPSATPNALTTLDELRVSGDVEMRIAAIEDGVVTYTYTNHGESELAYGREDVAEIGLQVLLDGQWYVVPTKRPGGGYESVAYTVRPGGTRAERYRLPDDLPAGVYRLVNGVVSARFSYAGDAGGVNALWFEAAQGEFEIELSYFDGESGWSGTLSDEAQKSAAVAALSSVPSVPVEHWSTERLTLPAYGVRIWNGGRSVSAVWSDGRLIMQDGSVYTLGFDPGELLQYDWSREKQLRSAAELPCGLYLSRGDGFWLPGSLAPAEELAPADSVVLEAAPDGDGAVTYSVVNSGSGPWAYGPGVSLQVRLEGEWYLVPPDPSAGARTDQTGTARAVGAGETRTHTYTLPDGLPSGKYRLVTGGLAAEFIYAGGEDLPLTPGLFSMGKTFYAEELDDYVLPLVGFDTSDNSFAFSYGFSPSELPFGAFRLEGDLLIATIQRSGGEYPAGGSVYFRIADDSPVIDDERCLVFYNFDGVPLHGLTGIVESGDVFAWYDPLPGAGG